MMTDQPLPSGPVNVFTIDVEDWYHCLDVDEHNWPRYEDRISQSVEAMLELLALADIRATFFVLGHVARKHPQLVRAIAQGGHEIASHGETHRMVYRQSVDEFRRDVRTSLARLEEITGAKVLGYRAPFFSITRQSLWAIDVLGELGLAYDSSIFPVHNPRYGIPDFCRLPCRVGGLVELPPSTLPLGGVNLPCAGGVYFRFAPYWLLRRAYRLLNRRREPIVFYIHPWEIDPLHPRVPLPRFLSLRHYWGLRGAVGKLRRLAKDFAFRPAREALGI
jgi:polysaccharide deacetylase family protein (PEP-CTERM system associated)